MAPTSANSSTQQQQQQQQHQSHPLEQVTFRMNNAFGKSICQPGWYWDQQTPFTDYDIFYVLSGSGTMQLGEEKFQLQRKSCLIMRPGDLPKATQHPNDRLTVLFMHFRIEGPPSWENSSLPFPRFTVVENAFQTETILYQLLEVNEFPLLLSELEFDCLMKRFIITLIRQQPDNRDRAFTSKQLLTIRQIKTYIRERGGIGIDWNELAGSVGMSTQYVSRLFKSSTGSTLKQYVAKTKMEHAQEMLAQTGMSLTEIAEYLGYSDLFAFSKSFKLAYGLAPSDYAAHIRQPIGLPTAPRPKPPADS
ncbi:helix-turn-helix domain-containing protein [Paenibacillus koleovorans]|uniref:helix-turn-helix domain-containing protein n=1 Tax=Paenibacillus koleovorans TaxID=121608 RepID=UPI000FDB7E4B|nr:AraC family transcriptional regulator [Paenibacillus koleovorans]